MKSNDIVELWNGLLENARTANPRIPVLENAGTGKLVGY